MYRRLAVLATGLATAAAGALTAAPAAHADSTDRAGREPASVTITTWGSGHGKGLSQYGARNRANAGESYRDIVEHYYPGTSWGTDGGRIRILLSGDTSSDVVVGARAGLKAHSLGSRKTWRLPAKRQHRKVKRWRITRKGAASVVSYRTSSWHRWRRAVGDAEFTAGGRPITLFTPAGPARYRGVLRSASVGSGRDTVNVVGLDAYLRGVVPQEVPATWPQAAVQAQAVAARTYASFERADAPAGRAYDLCDTDACQVYGGYDAEHPDSDAAVRSTAGEILTYDGAPAFAQFSASNGGYSVDGGYPYLVAEQDPEDHGIPDDPHSRTFTGEEITRHWTGLGDLVSVEVTERDGNGTDGVPGGRATLLHVTGTEGSVDVTGSAFRSYLGLRSTLLTITQV